MGEGRGYFFEGVGFWFFGCGCGVGGGGGGGVAVGTACAGEEGLVVMGGGTEAG